MKKLIIIIVLLLPLVFTAQAQTWDEWFRQKKTQKKYLLDQIAALQANIGYIKQANKIIKDGTGLISSIKDGDLKLHTGYFNSLKSVKSSISNNSMVKAIISMQEEMAASRTKTILKADDSKQFTNTEIIALKRRLSDLSTEAEKDLDELLLVISDGKVEMTDDQRLKVVNRLYRRMQDKYLLQKVLSTNVLALAQARWQATADAKTFKALQGTDH